MNRAYFTVLLALLLCGAATPVLAEDVVPTFDAALCKAPYPERSKTSDEQGELILSVLVSTEGVAADLKIVQSTGYRELDKAGVVAAARCKFVPGSKDGKAVEGWTEVRYSWKL